jgi:hypothetical protein
MTNVDANQNKDAIDKPVTPLARPGTEQPAGLLSAKPLMTVPTTARATISPNVKAELGKLGSEKAGRIRSLVARK